MNEYEIQDHRKERLQAAVTLFRVEGKGGATGLGKAIGYKDGAFIRQMLSGKRAVSEKTVYLIEALPGMEDWFTTKSIKLTSNPPPATSIDTLAVPVLANAASMGLGHDAEQEDVLTGSLMISIDWVHKHVNVSQADRLRFIHAYGDSMEPTFSSGDILLVDTASQSVKIDGVYVLEAHDRIFVKRVRQRMDGTFEISSDNPTHKTVDTLNGEHAVTVKGRVVWAWNGKRL